MLRPEQKNIVCMIDMVAKFSGSGHLIVGICAGTMAVATICMFMHEYHSFVGFRIVKVSSKKPHQASGCCKNVFSSRSDVIENEEICKIGSVFLTKDGKNTNPTEEE